MLYQLSYARKVLSAKDLRSVQRIRQVARSGLTPPLQFYL